jgi:Zn-dependent protease
LDLSLQGIIGRLLLYIPVLLLSLTVHEFAHAWSAKRLGDDTAERMGRLTLNPLAHADPIGTFILPLLNVPFGWAKPVPINPARFRRGVDMGKGMMLSALAGPFSNICLGVICAGLLGVYVRATSAASVDFRTLENMAFVALTERTDLGVARVVGVPFLFLVQMCWMNVVLAFFNLLPIPPLDGSRIVDAFLPVRFRPRWETFSRFSVFALLAFVFFGWPLLMRPVLAAFVLLIRLASVLT